MSGITGRAPRQMERAERVVSDRIQTIVPHEMKEWYDSMAADEGVTTSTYVRRVLEAHKAAQG